MSKGALNAVAIGASAGAVQALLRILPLLPANFPVPVLIVVHVPSDRSNALVSLFRARCNVNVKEAEDKELAVAGTVYFAPSDYHLLVERDGSLALSSDEQVNFSRPAIDVLLESAADAFGSGLLGIILTGANQDGADGLRVVSELGGTVLIENPDSASSAIMPSAALEKCPGARVENLSGIASFLLTLAVK